MKKTARTSGLHGVFADQAIDLHLPGLAYAMCPVRGLVAMLGVNFPQSRPRQQAKNPRWTNGIIVEWSFNALIKKTTKMYQNISKCIKYYKIIWMTASVLWL